MIVPHHNPAVSHNPCHKTSCHSQPLMLATMPEVTHITTPDLIHNPLMLITTTDVGHNP